MLYCIALHYITFYYIILYHNSIKLGKITIHMLAKGCTYILYFEGWRVIVKQPYQVTANCVVIVFTQSDLFSSAKLWLDAASSCLACHFVTLWMTSFLFVLRNLHFNLRKQAALKCAHTHRHKNQDGDTWYLIFPAAISSCILTSRDAVIQHGHHLEMTTAPLCDHRIVLRQLIACPPCWFDGSRDSKS